MSLKCHALCSSGMNEFRGGLLLPIMFLIEINLGCSEERWCIIMLCPIIHPSIRFSFFICHSSQTSVLQAVINLPSLVQDLTHCLKCITEALLLIQIFLSLMRVVPIKELQVIFRNQCFPLLSTLLFLVL